MPEEPTAADTEREEAIVAEAVAALQGTATGADDHQRERRRVRAVIDAIRAAR